MADTNTNVKNTFQKRKFKKPYKAKGKGKGAPKSKLVRSSSDPVNTYISQCCGARGVKTPCVRSGAAEYDALPLGSWRCSQCNKPAKVSRHKNKIEEPVSA